MDSKTQKKQTEHAAAPAADPARSTPDAPTEQSSQRTQRQETEQDDFEFTEPAPDGPTVKPTPAMRHALVGSKLGAKPGSKTHKAAPGVQHAVRRRASKYSKDVVCKFTTAASLRITQKGGCKTRDRATKEILTMIANKFIEALAAGAIA